MLNVQSERTSETLILDYNMYFTFINGVVIDVHAALSLKFCSSQETLFLFCLVQRCKFYLLERFLVRDISLVYVIFFDDL